MSDIKTRSESLRFVQDRVLNITDITRTTKLAEILDEYAKGESEDIFVVQNTRNKDAKGVLVDLEYFERLLRYEEVIEQITDEMMYEVTLSRKDEKADISFSEIIAESGLDIDDIIELSKTIQEDE